MDSEEPEDINMKSYKHQRLLDRNKVEPASSLATSANPLLGLFSVTVNSGCQQHLNIVRFVLKVVFVCCVYGMRVYLRCLCILHNVKCVDFDVS